MGEDRIPTLDYLSRDFDSIRQDLVNLIPFFTPEWTDRNANDMGIVLLELFSAMGDVLHFYLDRRAQNLYLPLAFTRSSVVNLLKLIDFEVAGKTAARADEKFTLGQSPLDESILIPVGARLQAPAPTGGATLTFETVADLLFGFTTLTADAPDGGNAKKLTVVNSSVFVVGQKVNLRDDNDTTGEDHEVESIPDSTTVLLKADVIGPFTVANSARVSVIEATIGVVNAQTFQSTLGTSQGTAFQLFQIPDRPVVEGALQIFVNETGTPELWEAVDSLVLSGPTDKHYEVTRDADGFVFVRFGDGTQGKIPIATATIDATYLIGGGPDGNVGANKITTLLTSIGSSLGTVLFTVTNPLPAAGGANEQTLEDARFEGPRSLRALNRAVTLEDYSTLARQVDGVGDAKAVVRLPTLLREYDIFVIPAGGFVPPQTLLNQVEVFLEERKVAGTVIFVQGPKHIVLVFLIADVTVQDNVDQATVSADVNNAVTTFFSAESAETQFGKNVNLSDIMALIDNITGVDHVDISKLTLDPPTTLDWEILSQADSDELDVTVTLVDGQSPPLGDEEFIILVTGDGPLATFDVKTPAGVVLASGTAGDGVTPPVEADVGRIKVSIINNDATANPLKISDRARFNTSQFVGNVEINDFEIRQSSTITLTFQGGVS